MRLFEGTDYKGVKIFLHASPPDKLGWSAEIHGKTFESFITLEGNLKTWFGEILEVLEENAKQTIDKK